MLKLTTAKSIVKKTWEKAMGKKKPTKRDLKVVINKFYNSRKDEVEELYNLLQPFINRVKRLDEMTLDDLILETQEDKNRHLLEKRLEKSRGNYVSWIN